LISVELCFRHTLTVYRAAVVWLCSRVLFGREFTTDSQTESH